jgi:hypothetical protein
MWVIGTVLSLLLIALILADGFEVILQPRRVTHRFRFARLFYRGLWRLWRTMALGLFPAGKRREACLSVFGPVSVLGLFTLWVLGLIVGFGLLHWSLATAVQAPEHRASLGTYLYLSGTTFFTLGYGDVIPMAGLGRALAVLEAGLGFGFLAIVISYLPVLYQAFSQREVTISLMDARAGSPPSAAQLLLRLARAGGMGRITTFLGEWERWSAELLESHLSFPVLSYYRSQHDNQSWLGSLTTMLDTCAVLLAEVKGADAYQAQLTFAMARHVAVDLGLVLKVTPLPLAADRLPGAERERLRQLLREAGVPLRPDDGGVRLTQLRAMYEPFVNGLSRRLLFALSPIVPLEESADNWQRSAWQRRVPGIGSLGKGAGNDEHFA